MKQQKLFNDEPPKKKETKYDLKKKAIPYSDRIISILPEYLITFAGTGHRPDKLGSYNRLEQNEQLIVPLLTKFLHIAHEFRHNHPDDKIMVISGMAQGWDTWLAKAALDSGVCHLWLSLPCESQESRWPLKAQTKYHEIIQQANRITTVCKEYDHDCMQLRNEHMVDNCDVVLAMWNGTAGGTGNCIDYVNSLQQPKHIINFWTEYAPLLGLRR